MVHTCKTRKGIYNFVNAAGMKTKKIKLGPTDLEFGQPYTSQINTSS